MTDPSIYYLTMADLRVIAADAVGSYAVRDPGLLASAAARPQATVFGADAYPTIWEKTAALLHSVASNHPLIDDNKRLAISAAIVFLARNRIDVDRLDEDRTFDLMIEVAKGQLVEIADIAAQLAVALGHPL